MMRTHRVRRSYDHRLRDAIAATGNADLFRDVAIPASTRRTWARGEIRPVVASVDVELEVYELLEQVDSLRQRAKVHAAIIGLLVRVLRLRGGKFDADRVPDGVTKSAVLRAITSASGLLSLGTALRIVGVSTARYHAWRRKEEGCGLDDQPSCPKSTPSQFTRDEVSTMRDFVESESYRHVAVQNLALYAQRLGKLFASVSTWYKMIRERGWKRPRRRVHPAKPKTGLRATRPNEYWQVDATVIRLTTGIRIYLQAVIDNFSRRILAWRVSDTLSSATTRELLIEASKGLPDDSSPAKVTVVTDGGSENFGEVDHLLKDSSSLRRVLAQIDIISSNSLIEAFWRQLKHAWLFLNTLDSAAAVRRLVAFYVREHNEKIPRAVLGARTPDEVYFSREENALERLSEQRKTAQKVRSVANRAASCYRCEPSRAGPAVRSVARTGPRRKPARKSA
jgi:transposase InsO family protein